jgi:hypothetical protein
VKVAIPSAGRAQRLSQATLPLLLRGGVPAADITVFCPDEFLADYAPVCKAARCGLVSGFGLGMRTVRNVIARHYPVGTQLVEVDDDITAFQRCVDPQLPLEPYADVCTGLQLSFDLARGHLWCWYPVSNSYFMRPGRIRYGELWYAVGALFGYTVCGDDAELVYLDDKEDFERSIRFYLRDGEVVRFDELTFATRYYGEPGGMQLYRTPQTIEAGARQLVANYPDLASYRVTRQGRPEVKLRRVRGGSRGHQPAQG